MLSITNLIVDCTKFNLTQRPYGLIEYVSDLIYSKANLNSIWLTLNTNVGISTVLGSPCITYVLDVCNKSFMRHTIQMYMQNYNRSNSIMLTETLHLSLQWIYLSDFTSAIYLYWKSVLSASELQFSCPLSYAFQEKCTSSLILCFYLFHKVTYIYIYIKKWH